MTFSEPKHDPFEFESKGPGDCVKCGRMILWGEAVIAVTEWRTYNYVASRHVRGDMHMSCDPVLEKRSQA